MKTRKTRTGLLVVAAVLVAGCSSPDVLTTATSVTGTTAAAASPSPAALPAPAAAPASTPSAAVPTQVAGAQVMPSALVAGGTLQLQVGGVAGVPGDALAAVLNVTVTNPVAAGFVTAWPCGQPQPLASNLNYVAGQSVPNLAIVRLGTGGKVCLYSMVATDLVADVAGYFPAGSGYAPIDNPTRILDTRNGTGAPAADVPAGGTLQLQVGGVAGVPGDALAAVLNVTVTNPAAAGFVTAWPCGQPQPLASNLNYVAGQSVPNLAIVRLGTGGKVCLYSMVATDLVADVAGYFPAGSGYAPIDNPTRILDTRNGTGAPAADVPAGGTLQLQVGGVAGVPGDALAAVLNVTVTNPAAAGFVTAWPCGQPQPLASNLNYVAGQSVPNLAIVRLGTGGKVCLYSMVATDLVADVAGYFPAGSGYAPIDNPTRILDTRDGTGVAPGTPVTPGSPGSPGTPNPGTPGTPGAPTGTCQFQVADKPVDIAMCETFDAPAGNGGRSGDLEPVLWGVSRTNSNTNPGGDEFLNHWQIASIQGCGSTDPVSPPADVRVCGGRVYEAVNDGDVQTVLAMYPKQPFNWAGRTGTVVFDVSSDSGGGHAAWPEFWITNRPIPAPQGTVSGGQYPDIEHGFGFVLADDQCGGDPGKSGVSVISVVRNYVGQDMPIQNKGCVTDGSAAAGLMNHFEVRLAQDSVWIYGTDAGSSDLKLIAEAHNLNLSFTQGLVWLEDVHYNASKGNIIQTMHTFAWDNLGFDGPKTYRDLSFDVPDANQPSGGAVNLGYRLTATGGSFNVSGVHWTPWGQSNPTGAIVTLNWMALDNNVPSVRVNGGPWIATPWPFSDGQSTMWRSIAVPINLANVNNGGSNVIEMTYPTNTVVSNINLIVIAGSPVP